MRGSKAKQLRREIYGNDYSHKAREYKVENHVFLKQVKDKLVKIVKPTVSNNGLRALYQQRKREYNHD